MASARPTRMLSSTAASPIPARAPIRGGNAISGSRKGQRGVGRASGRGVGRRV